MKELEIQAIKQLINFYELFIHAADKDMIKQKAKELYDAAPASTLVHELTSNSFGNLFGIAYDDVGSGLNPPTKEEAKQILEKLKKLLKELEKQ